MLRKLIPLALGLAATAALAVAPATAGATPNRSLTGLSHSPTSTPPPSHLATIAQVLNYTKGKRIGPSVDTGYGVFTITGFYLDSTGGWVRTRSGVTYSDPRTLAENPNLVTPDSWWNPTSWNWKHILGTAWDALWNKCLKGAVSGLLPSVGGTTMVNLIARGAKVVPGPYGYAAIAIGGCTASLLDY